MLRGEAGNQAREIEELIAWLKTQPKPDVFCLSNALLIGMARRLKSDLGAPVVCALRAKTPSWTPCPKPTARRAGGRWPNGRRRWTCSSRQAAILAT